MPDPVIIAENICKSFGTLKAVSDLSFSVEPGTCFGLLGPNGAGKTTMMKMIYGRSLRDTTPPSKIQVFGFDPKNDELAIKCSSGVVSQEDNLDEELNVEQNLRIFARFYSLNKKTASERMDELLKFMGLTVKRKAKIKELSGGMKRRLVIARALLNNPRLLILDEPTTGLDPQVRHLIWEKIRGLKRDGMTILLTTHYMEEAFQLCDTIIIMDKGASVISGNPQELVNQRIERFVLEIYAGRATAIGEPFEQEGIRVDTSEQNIRLYSNDNSLLEEVTHRLRPGDYYLRQSNLEDLFLKATGRTLNVKQ